MSAITGDHGDPRIPSLGIPQHPRSSQIGVDLSDPALIGVGVP
jgi:hypothetical protein